MENFKNKLKKRRILFIVVVILIVAVSILEAFSIIGSSKETFTDGMTDGIAWGTYIALGFGALAQIIRISRMLTNETMLKKAYNRENDERLKMIRSKAGMPMLLITSIAMFVVGIAFSSINETVFYTLLAAGYVQLLCGVGVKLYCLKTM